MKQVATFYINNPLYSKYPNPHISNSTRINDLFGSITIHKDVALALYIEEFYIVK